MSFLHAAALLPLLVIALAVGVVVVLLNVTSGVFRGDAHVWALLAAFLTAGSALNVLLSTAGIFLCLAAPPESRAAEVALVGVVAQVLALVLNAARSLAMLWPDLVDWLPWVAWVQMGVFVL